MLMFHGAFDRWTLQPPQVTSPGNSKPAVPEYQTTPTSSHPTPNYADPNPEHRDAVSLTSALSLEGHWNILSWLSLYGQIDFLYIRSPGNIRANPPVFDCQYTMGLSCSL
jgi:hypothetical protein